jgi:hypothetical protein
LALWTALYIEGSLTIMTSPSLTQSQELFRKSVHAYRDLDQPVGVEKISELRLELKNGSRIVSLPGSIAPPLPDSPPPWSCSTRQ